MEQGSASIGEFSIVRQHRRMLANMNNYLTKESRILDFGCGAGEAVYQYRDAGFDAYGFDVRPAVVCRMPQDERFFRFATTGKPVNVPEYVVDQSTFKIPFEDQAFDFVFSTSTLEHVQDHELAFAESARVLRSGGVAIHTFPARYVPIEPHMHVPLGSVVQNYYWFLFWAIMGIRNEFQKHMSAVDCARINLHYSRTGLKYLKIRELRGLALKYFSKAELIPHLWEFGDGGGLSKWGVLMLIPLVDRYFRWLYGHCHTVVLFLQR
ncbi:MAG: class I SAM-dependent methyltransferase [Nitrospira sp.]|nr:class I SAM-dependent methyltransferase [Nitrospira sp.]